MAATAAPELFGPDILDGKMFSGGWIAGSDRLATTEPATGEQLAEVGTASPADIHRAAEVASKAQAGVGGDGPARSCGDPPQGGRRAAGQQGGDHRLAHPRGRLDHPRRPTSRSAWPPPSCARPPASAPRMRGEVIPEPGDKLSIAMRVPIGVVGVIAPWNVPLVLGMRSVAPALALVTAATSSPIPTRRWPAGSASRASSRRPACPRASCTSCRAAPRPEQAVCTAPHVGMVSFTGSTAAGRKVGATCGENLKKVGLELGGKSSFIVLEDADLDAAASSGAWGSFLHQGQICMASGRHLVHEKVAAEYLEKLAAKAAHLPVGNPATEQVALGPIINAKQFEKVQGIVSDTIAQGAQVLAGGEGSAPYFPATVLAEMTPEMRGWREEIFGPVAPVMTFSDDEEVIARANDTEYGLSNAVFTSDLTRVATSRSR